MTLKRHWTCLAVLVLSSFFQSAHAQNPGAGDIVLRPGAVATMHGQWTKLADATAAGGTAAWFPNAGAAKVLAAVPQPSSFFEITFDAPAGVPYRLWLRLRAQNNDWANDSVFVQFSGSVDTSSNPVYRIGTASAAEVNRGGLQGLRHCGLGVAGQRLGGGRARPGRSISRRAGRTRSSAMQSREDGAFVDQTRAVAVEISVGAPGATKNDTTILRAADSRSDGYARRALRIYSRSVRRRRR